MIKIERKDKIDIISFSVDKIDALITDEIREEINKVFENSFSKVIINLSGVEYIDSSGFSCFLSILRTAKNSYSILKFANPEPRVMELFQTLHLHTVFEIYHDLEVCIGSLR
ncbi:MAG: STAS domain-containing protein [Bacteroidales bacterium]|nr:STAS domain-containing protein [Bacteroidales bacterium]